MLAWEGIWEHKLSTGLAVVLGVLVAGNYLTTDQSTAIATGVPAIFHAGVLIWTTGSALLALFYKDKPPCLPPVPDNMSDSSADKPK